MLSRLRRGIRQNFFFLRGMWQASMNLAKGTKHFEAWLRARLGELEASIKRGEEEEEDLLFQTVGQALTAWSYLEDSLVAITAFLLRTSGDRAGLILYSIVNFNTWLTIIHDLFETDSELGRFQKRWNKISERIRRIKDQRDQIAHHAVSLKSPVLLPSKWDVRRKSVQQSPMSVGNAMEFIRTVGDITKAALELADQIGTALVASKEKSAEPKLDHSSKSDSQ